MTSSLRWTAEGGSGVCKRARTQQAVQICLNFSSLVAVVHKRRAEKGQKRASVLGRGSGNVHHHFTSSN